MQERHLNRKKYFDEQSRTTSQHVIPYLKAHHAIECGFKVLEIGCGEGGNLAPLLDLECEVVGVDYVSSRIELARSLFATHPRKDRLELVVEDIYQWDAQGRTFDLIIMRDVIEHIHDQHKFMGVVKKFMHSTSCFFLAFPPWQNPFGGHQQICSNRILSKLPYFHLLPKMGYKMLLRVCGESTKTIEDLLEIKETGISLERFEGIAGKHGYLTTTKTWWLINPNYEIKFGLKPRVIWRIPASIPYFRNYFITCGYYILGLDATAKNHIDGSTNSKLT
jgi:2-polyprenyl-3-methyl-5-hydroxy-6-metoxy-1,4-benzoquinol methylase